MIDFTSDKNEAYTNALICMPYRCAMRTRALTANPECKHGVARPGKTKMDKRDKSNRKEIRKINPHIYGLHIKNHV